MILPSMILPTKRMILNHQTHADADMFHRKTNRRSFLSSAAGAALAAGWLSSNRRAVAQDAAAAQPAAFFHPVRLGGPVFGAPKDPDGLAAAHRKLGYRAAYCPSVPLGDKDRIRDIVQAFAKYDVVIAEVGRWCNLLEADPAKRAANLKTVTDGLALAEEIGARCCVDIAGSYNRTSWFGPHPKNLSKEFFDAAVENARKIIDAVKPRRAKFGYEMLGWALPDSADSYLAMIKAVDRPGFGVHLDPCNAINCPGRYYDNTALLNECFDKLGPWIVSCHAKDLTWDVEMNVHFREVPAGRGQVDLTTYLRRIARLDHEAPLMIEHCANPAEYDQARQFLQKLGPAVGVPLA
jgi:sugar phosphate isomerase/epimerase